MGKKYLDTKKGSLESSILGVWEEAAEVKEGGMKRGKDLKTFKKKPKKEEVKEATNESVMNVSLFYLQEYSRA